MISQQTIETVKATIPVLEQHGVTITKTFYETMFERNPEVKNFFNMSHQRDGKQPLALAQTVLAAAKHIERLADILPAVQHIGHKHRSLNILPEHYPIVGENLLLAIQKVLGEAATPAIIDAWAEAYGAIADAFIAMERAMYERAGWQGYKRMVITDKVVESANITSFYFTAADGSALPLHVPGQYISLKWHGEQFDQPRQYSLSCAPNNDYYRISVKREEGGVVSPSLHEELNVGDTIEVTAPAGEFVYEESTAPLVLLAGGVGVTPLLSMMKVATNREVTFVQAVQNEALRPFAVELPEATVFYSDEGQFVTKQWLAEHVAKEAHVYICGPAPFMESCRAALAELSVSYVKFEAFGPLVS